ncbi:MAG: hypothetical protein L0I76_23185 [Pseudonocardia sp.]|nr:hypothetical protein [Pseudonocardia sp.]
MLGNLLGIRLDSMRFLIAVLLGAVFSFGVLCLGWNRWPHRRLGRSVSLVLAVAGVVLTAGVLANRGGSFYPTVGALVATAPPLPMPGRVPVRTGRGEVVSVRSPQVGGLQVYLPAGYRDPGLAAARFGVLEWLSTVPLDRSGLAGRLDAAIAADRLPPVMVVAVPSGRDAGAVRQWAIRTLRARSDRAGWSVAGPVDGTGCPLEVALRRPADYAAAAGPACRARLPRIPTDRLDLLATATADRPAEVSAAKGLHASPPASIQVTEYVVDPSAAGGPGASDPAVLEWLGARLPAPIVGPEGHSGVHG